jgi:mono/diheme cytochrome c family protein
VRNGKRAGAALALCLGIAGAGTVAQDAGVKPFPPEQIKRGADVYASHCVTCHGPRLANPEWAVDLRKFPREDRARFIDTVTYGVRNMPPWGDLIAPADVEALWAYVIAGEPRN